MDQPRDGTLPDALQVDDDGRRYWLISIFVTLLALPVLPLEFGLGKVPLGQVIAGIAIWLTVVHTRRRQHFDRLEIALIVLAVWVAFRLLVLAPLSGEPVSWWLALRDIGLYVAAVCVYRLAQEQVLHKAIKRGLIAAFAILVALGAYQLASGLDRLRTFGYTVANDFHYYTEAGDLRPFGLFAGPTTFGTFVAMVGTFLALTARNRTRAALLAVTTFVAVAATETRAAIVGVALVGAVAVLMSPRIRRSALLWVSVLSFAVLMLVTRPAVLMSSWNRLLAASDASENSRTSRFAIWNGIVEETFDRGDVLTGMASANWVETMSSHIGSMATILGHAHNNFFESWYKYGLIGALLFAVLLAIALSVGIAKIRLHRPFALGSLGALLIFAVDSIFNNSLSSTNYVLALFLLLGMSGPASTDRKASPPARSKSGALIAAGHPFGET